MRDRIKGVSRVFHVGFKGVSKVFEGQFYCILRGLLLTHWTLQTTFDKDTFLFRHSNPRDLETHSYIVGVPWKIRARVRET